jgi:cobalt-zinc-cadmium efflux system protein
MILWSSIGIIRESLNILLEGIPRGMNLERIEACIRSTMGVNDVHDLHVWSIGSDTHSLSCHVSIADMRASESEALLRVIRDELSSRFHIHHTTIQFEYASCEVAHGCVIPASPGHAHAHDH